MASLSIVIRRHMDEEQRRSTRALFLFARWMKQQNCYACAVHAPPSKMHALDCAYRIDTLTASEAREILHEAEWEVGK